MMTFAEIVYIVFLVAPFRNSGATCLLTDCPSDECGPKGKKKSKVLKSKCVLVIVKNFGF